MKKLSAGFGCATLTAMSLFAGATGAVAMPALDPTSQARPLADWAAWDCSRDPGRVRFMLDMQGLPTLRAVAHALPGRNRVMIRRTHPGSAVAIVQQIRDQGALRLRLRRTLGKWYIVQAVPCQRKPPNQN